MSDVGGTPAPAQPIEIRATIAHEKPDVPKPNRMRETLLLLVELVKATAWPLLALVFFLLFQQPIRRTIALVPDKLEKADKAAIGSLSWEIQRHATEQGGNDLAVRVGTLSAAAVEELLKTPRDGSMGFVSKYTRSNLPTAYILPSESRMNGFRELESAQLLKFREPLGDWLEFVSSLHMQDDKTFDRSYGRTVAPSKPLTSEQRARLEGQYYELTPKGTQASEAIVKAVGQQLVAR
jgi:hypothetical protein